MTSGLDRVAWEADPEGVEAAIDKIRMWFPSVAVAAAISVGQQYALNTADPVVVQETNNECKWRTDVLGDSVTRPQASAAR